MVHPVLAQGSQFAVARCAQSNALRNARPMADRLEHHPPADHELHRLAELSRGRRGERRLGPGKELASEPRAQKFRDDADVFFRYAQHLRKHVAMVDDALRRFVQRKRGSIPDGDRCMQLDRVVSFGRQVVRLV